MQIFIEFKVLTTQGQYSLARAQQSFKSLVQIHEKNGKFVYKFNCWVLKIIFENLNVNVSRQKCVCQNEWIFLFIYLKFIKK